MRPIIKKIALITLVLFLGSPVFGQTSRRSKATIKTTAECQYCKQSIEKTVSAIKGVRKVSCDYKTHEVNVVYNARQVSLADIKKALNDLGYDADDQPANNLKTKTIQHSKTQ